MKLRSYLIVLVVAALLPLLIFAGIMTALYDSQHQATVESQMLDTTRALSLAVDREVATWVSALEALGSSKHLDSGNLSAFREEAVRVLKTRKDWFNILLADSEGRHLMNLLRPLGSPLPSVRELEHFQRVIKTSRPDISDLFFGRVSGRNLINVSIPVARGGKVQYILIAAASLDALMQILAEQNSPADWIGTIIDRKRIIIARTRNFEQFLGKPAMELRGAPSGEAEEGWAQGTTDDGTDVRVAFRRSELTGWTIRLAIPVSILEAPLRRSLWITVSGGLVLLVVGIMLAIGLGQQIARSVVRLSASAEALGYGEVPQAITSPIFEVNQVGRVIEDAAAKRKELENHLRSSLERVRTLNEIILATSSLSRHNTLEMLLDKVDLLLPYSATTIRLFNTETGALELVASRNYDEEAHRAAPKRAGSPGLVHLVVKGKAPLVIENVQTDLRVRSPEFLREHGFVSYLGIPLIAQEHTLGIIGFYTKQAHKFGDDEIDFLSAVAGQAAIAIYNSQLHTELISRAVAMAASNEELQRSRRELRNLTRHLNSVQEETRADIAREIHDEFGQALTGLKMYLSWLQKKLPRGQEALLEKTGSMLTLLDQAIQSVRRIATRLRPSVLDDLGLVAAMEWQLQDFQSRTGIKANFSSRLPKGPLDRDMSTTLFRIFQEALMNIARHAVAKDVRVSLEHENGDLLLEVNDNGKGISESKISDPKSLGLLGMKERALLLGGELRIKGSRGKGTTVAVRVPLAQERHGDAGNG